MLPPEVSNGTQATVIPKDMTYVSTAPVEWQPVKRKSPVSFRQALRRIRVRKAPAGRNDPCPCGSGHKYKRCHGK